MLGMFLNLAFLFTSPAWLLTLPAPLIFPDIPWPKQPFSLCWATLFVASQCFVFFLWTFRLLCFFYFVQSRHSFFSKNFGWAARFVASQCCHQDWCELYKRKPIYHLSARIYHLCARILTKIRRCGKSIVKILASGVKKIVGRQFLKSPLWRVATQMKLTPGWTVLSGILSTFQRHS